MQDADGNFILPDELLIRILRYVEKERKTVNLVCKKFYDIGICEIGKYKQLALSCGQLEDEESFETLMNLRRKYKKLLIHSLGTDFHIYNRLRSFCLKYGAYVTELRWERCEMMDIECGYILSSFPNLESLICLNWNIKENSFGDQIFTNKLKNLKHLRICWCNETAKIMFNEKILEKHTLNTYETAPEYMLRDLLMNQKNLKRLECYWTNSIVDDLDSVDLSDLCLHYYSDSDQVHRFAEILTKQSNLTSLDISQFSQTFKHNQQAFINICQLKLTKLNFELHGVDSILFKNHFWRLNDLIELSINLRAENKEYFFDMRFPKLKTLNLNIATLWPEHSSKMERNLPALQKLEINTNVIDHILNHLTTLQEISVIDDEIIFNGEQKYPNIIKVYFETGSSQNNRYCPISKDVSLLYKTMENFPNLCSLTFILETSLRISLLDEILIKLPRLTTIECLSLCQRDENFEPFNEESAYKLLNFVRTIPNACLKLKLKKIEIDEIKLSEILEKYFDVIRYNQCSIYHSHAYEFLIETKDQCCICNCPL